MPSIFRVFIITDKTKVVGEESKGVGVMKDEELTKPLTHYVERGDVTVIHT